MPVSLPLFQPHCSQSRFGFLKNQRCQYSGPVSQAQMTGCQAFMTGCQNEEDENIPVGVLLSPNKRPVYPQSSQSFNTGRPILSPPDYRNALEL